ncbi:MAG: 4-(cytidine 5'-diphospho)-2-C-methyl-D-erythritol kinase [Deltaproteobacteria bacterium]|nr:4-(cytidine 5'-diphospho)-2-C-methyl-D-erythritol kinase [Deltaproteobacteria bacterium]
MACLTIHSPAKVNLFLKVLKKRSDGYHDIITVMQPITYYDEIFLDVSDGDDILIECDNKNIPSDNTNIAFKAAKIFLSKTGFAKKVSIKIKKNIPVAAGLGGGSSNAAYVLMGLNEILNAGLSKEDLMEIGEKLGSDVPFFVFGGSAIAAGRGEKLEKIELPKFWYVIINPCFPVSTAWAYENLDLTKKQENINIPFLKKRLKTFSIEDILENDLENVTVKKYPDIENIKASLKNLGAKGAMMSGSGPTVFGIFENEGAAKSAFDCINKEPKFKKMAVFVAQGL